VVKRSTLAAPDADLFTQVRRLTEASEAPVQIPCERIGRYELVFKLASGGMADVYLARDESAPNGDQVVALKRVHRHLIGRPDYREMFLDEARIAFQISHPNVCSVLDFGESQGEYYLTMEYLVGEPLARLINRVARQADPSGTALIAGLLARTIADVCKGLDAAHNLKSPNGSLLEVVHRDVTPRNLFLTYDGRAQVLDFGIATAKIKLHSGESGKLRGNVAYMAPEQLTNAPTDRRADIWSLGVTSWEMLAMRRLFKRKTPAAMAESVVYDEIPPPSALRPGIPHGLDEIVLKALRRDPDERWQSAHEMELAIRQVLNAQPVVIGPADLADWMSSVFPFEEARKRQLIRMAGVGSRGRTSANTQGQT
jgi:serine/threonine-protein kinase